VSLAVDWVTGVLLTFILFVFVVTEMWSFVLVLWEIIAVKGVFTFDLDTSLLFTFHTGSTVFVRVTCSFHFFGNFVVNLDDTLVFETETTLVVAWFGTVSVFFCIVWQRIFSFRIHMFQIHISHQVRRICLCSFVRYGIRMIYICSFRKENQMHSHLVSYIQPSYIGRHSFYHHIGMVHLLCQGSACGHGTQHLHIRKNLVYRFVALRSDRWSCNQLLRKHSSYIFLFRRSDRCLYNQLVDRLYPKRVDGLCRCSHHRDHHQ